MAVFIQQVKFKNKYLISDLQNVEDGKIPNKTYLDLDQEDLDQRRNVIGDMV